MNKFYIILPLMGLTMHTALASDLNQENYESVFQSYPIAETQKLDTWFVAPTGEEVGAWIKRASERARPLYDDKGNKYFHGNFGIKPRSLNTQQYNAWLNKPRKHIMDENAERQSSLPYPLLYPEGAFHHSEFIIWG